MDLAGSADHLHWIYVERQTCLFDKNHFDLGMCNVQCASPNVYINRCAHERVIVCVESVFEAGFMKAHLQ